MILIDYAEENIQINDVLKAFPDKKIISTLDGSLSSYDKEQSKWVIANYRDIIC